MSDPVLGNAARWHDTSPLYGEDVGVPFVPYDAASGWRLALMVNIGQAVSRASVVTVHGGEHGGAIVDASRHDL